MSNLAAINSLAKRGAHVYGLLAAVLFFASATSILATRRERAVDLWQPTNFNVALTFNDPLTEITKARTEITVEVLKDQLTVVDLDFGEMPVDGVMIDGTAAQFDRAQDRLNVHLAAPAGKGRHFVIAVDYHGKPRDGLILTADKDGRPSATGDNWPNRVHHWIPCLDHPSAKATVTFAVTAPARDLVIANGRLDRAHDDSQTTRTWSYTEAVPIPAYCMVIAVAEYARSGPALPAITPLWYYVPRTDAKYAVQGFAAAAPSLKFYSEKIAPFPYEKLALIVGATRFGGMENASAIVFPSGLLDQRSGASRISRAFIIPERLEDVVAHEIAHQWFGDSVTESTWSDLWLSEGFATYFAALVIEEYDGEEAFRDYLKRAAETYFAYEKSTKSPIHDTETEDLLNLLNANNYQKGAWVLHMLRRQLGDDAFFKGLRYYYNSHKDKTASSDDLRAALEKASDRDLKEFFGRWIYGTGHPRYDLSWAWQDQGQTEGVVTLTLRQTQADAAFLDPVPIKVTAGDLEKRLTISPAGKLATSQLTLSRKPTSVTLDPDETILKETGTR